MIAASSQRLSRLAPPGALLEAPEPAGEPPLDEYVGGVVQPLGQASPRRLAAFGMAGLALVAGVSTAARTLPVCGVEQGLVCVSPEFSRTVGQAERLIRGGLHLPDVVEDHASGLNRTLEPLRSTERPPPIGGELAVVSWNLHHGQSPDGEGARHQLDQMLEVLQKERADVVLLQEVSPWHAQDLVNGTGMRGVYTLTTPLQGNLVLLRPDIEVQDQQRVVITHPDPAGSQAEARELVFDHARGEPEPRVLQLVRVRTPGGAELTVWNTHFPTGSSGESLRLSSATRAYDAIDTFAGVGPVLGGGDLNARADHPVVSGLESRGYEVGGATIDWLASRGTAPAGIESEDFRAVDGGRLSDHPLVRGRVILTGNASAQD